MVSEFVFLIWSALLLDQFIMTNSGLNVRCPGLINSKRLNCNASLDSLTPFIMLFSFFILPQAVIQSLFPAGQERNANSETWVKCSSSLVLPDMDQLAAYLISLIPVSCGPPLQCSSWAVLKKKKKTRQIIPPHYLMSNLF